MDKICLLVMVIVFSIQGLAQSGKITGKVINASSGQEMGSATVILVEKSRTQIADQGGNFSFNKLEPGTYTIKCSYTGYNEKIIELIAVNNETPTTINISLDERKALDAVVVSAKVSARKETVNALLIAQKNNASVSDGISAESIRKTPDRSTSDVLKRVSGASIQDDRFAIIRGLNDRYNAAFINGAPLPSTESDRKAFAFDIFPASILDNLVIYKTATPDKNGEFAGGLIDITTKSILPKSFTSISIGGSYNSLLTGETRYFSEVKGKKDFLGIDDGVRAIPAWVPSAEELRQAAFEQKAAFAKLFGNYKWGVKNDKTSPNYNFQVSKGFNVEAKGKEFLGALLSLTYYKSYSFNEGERNTYMYDFITPGAAPPIQRSKFIDSIYNVETVLAGLANISVRIDNKNNLSWKNNLSINTDNKLIKRFGNPDQSSDPDFVNRDIVRWFTSNQIFSSQLNGEHLVGKIKTKINWLAAYSKVLRKIPNLSRTSYVGYLPNLSADIPAVPTQTIGSGTMFFTNTDENIKSIKADINQPYSFMKNSQNFFKMGVGFQVRNRDFTSRLLGLSTYNAAGVTFDYTLLSLPEDQIFTSDHLGKMTNGKGGFLLNDGTALNSDYDASSKLLHAYIMNDQRFFKKFRLIYGYRMERFHQNLNSLRDLTTPVNIKTVVTDFLPSVNFVYAVTPKINMRLSYAKTINRPEFRELAPFLFFDYVTQYTYEGSDSLKRAIIKNYDFRFEFFPGKAQLFSISAFYKDFTNPIEIVSNPIFDNLAIYSSAKTAEVYGLEAEFRTLISTLVGIKNDEAFLSKFTLAVNAAYMKSKVILGAFGLYPASLLQSDRALQGQSPYVINGSFAFNDEKSGLSATASLNKVGDRIAIAGTINAADIYEKSRTVLGFQVAKNLLKNKMEIKLTARDLLAQRISFYFDYDKNKSYSGNDRFFSSSRVARLLSLNASFKF